MLAQKSGCFNAPYAWRADESERVPTRPSREQQSEKREFT